MRTEPDVDFQSLWERIQREDGLNYALMNLGDLDPERATIGAAEESEKAKIEGGLSWWDRHHTKVKKFVCQNATIRKKGPVAVLQAIFGALVLPYGGPIATFATAVLVKKHMGSTIEAVSKDALNYWCGSIHPQSNKRPVKKPSKKPKPRN